MHCQLQGQQIARTLDFSLKGIASQTFSICALDLKIMLYFVSVIFKLKVKFFYLLESTLEFLWTRQNNFTEGLKAVLKLQGSCIWLSKAS
jgi:hypothetical protein